MPDDKTREPGSLTQTADAQKERISGISNVSQTVTQMQKTTQRQIEETKESIDYGQTPDRTMQEMNGVLSRFGRTITAFTKGIEDVTVSTAKATTDAIGQYGKAVGQDINYNKQNIVAMALSRTTPLFGYFAAKFMETDVYKKAKDRMSESISGVFKSVGSSIANIFRGKEKAHDEAVPKMQKGGYVEKGGMVEVHPAEVIMPIEKVLERIDESLSIAREASEITQKAQLRSMAKVATLVEAERQKEPVGMVKGFLRALREVQTQYEEPSNMRMLRAVLSIQDLLGATVGTWDQVWTKMLVEHPTFRQIAFTMRTMGQVFSAPFKIVAQVFKLRGGYEGQLSKSKNPFENIAANIGLNYVNSMYRLDNIALFTRATAEYTKILAEGYLSGQAGRPVRLPPIEGMGRTGWSIMSVARLILNWSVRNLPKGIVAGIDLMLGGTDPKSGTLYKWLEKAGDTLTRERRISPFTRRGRELEAAYGAGSPMWQILKDQEQGKLPPLTIAPSQKMIEYQEEVVELLEGVDYHSEVSSKELDKHNDRERRRGLMGMFSGLGNMAWTGLSMIGGFIKDLFGGAKGLIASSLGPLFAAGGPIAGLLTNPATWAVVGAGIAGYIAGSAFNKYVIAPIRDAIWESWDKSNKKASAELNKVRKDEIQKARGVTATGMESYLARVKREAEGSLTIGARQEDFKGALLGGPDLRLSEITKGQMGIIEKNIADYAKYDPDMLKKYRAEWLDGEGGSAFGMGRFFWQDPVKYGQRRESAFLNWLKRKAPQVDPQAMLSEHEASIYRKGGISSDTSYFVRKYGEKAKDWVAEKGKFALTKGGQLVEKATGKIIDAKDLAKMQASDLLASAELLKNEMKTRGMEGLEATKGLGDKLSNQLNNVSNVINQQASNVTRVYNSGMNKAGDLYDEMKQRIVTGNFH
jgi:hypothetical protein